MILSDVYQLLKEDDRVVATDQWTLASLSAEHLWAPCDSFVGRLVGDIHDRGRILFRRCIAKDEVQT